MAHLLDALKHFEPASSALALERVGRIGNELQFAQDKLRNQQDPVEKVRIADVGDAPVNDDAGVEHFKRLPRVALIAEQSPERLQVQHVALVRSDDQPDVK